MKVSEIKYRLIAKSLMGNTLAIKNFSVEPSFKDSNQFANRVSIKYGAHPRVIVEKIGA